MFVGGLKDDRNVNEYGFGVLKCSCCDGFSLTLFSFFSHTHSLTRQHASSRIRSYHARTKTKEKEKHKRKQSAA
jgi:hypothetical protein